MSTRTFVEINHDFLSEFRTAAIADFFVSLKGTTPRPPYGITVLGQRHHSDPEFTVPDDARVRRSHDPKDDVQWIVNDIAELGVMVNGNARFLYKGRSLIYEDGKHDDGRPMMYRPVFKREFGECCHPINHADYSKIGTVSLDDSDEWKPLPQKSDVPSNGREHGQFIAGMIAAAKLVEEEAHSAKVLTEEAAARGDSHAKMRLWSIRDAMTMMAEVVRKFSADAEWVRGEAADLASEAVMGMSDAEVRATAEAEGVDLEANAARFRAAVAAHTPVFSRPDDEALAVMTAKLGAALAEVERLERLVYVPGLWKCAKCKFSLTARVLYINLGRMAANERPQECANGCGPMWRVTERDAGNELCEQLAALTLKLRADAESGESQRG